MIHYKCSRFITGLCGLILSALPARSQTTLTISTGTQLSLAAGSTLAIDSLAMKPSASFSISGSQSLTRNSTLSHPSANPHINRVFHFASTISSFTGAITFHYNDAALNGLAENSLTLNVHDGSRWNAYTTNVTRDAVNNFVNTAGLTNIALDELTLASVLNPLPVVFSSISATCMTDRTQIRWVTEQESNTDYFQLEKSMDGISWSAIVTIKAAGNSASQQQYIANDNGLTGESYYRVAEYDLDGNRTVSSMVSARCSPDQQFEIHPNPVHAFATVTISATNNTKVVFQVYDTRGTVVKIISENVATGINRRQINLSALAAGTYWIRAAWEHHSEIRKVVKE